MRFAPELFPVRLALVLALLLGGVGSASPLEASSDSVRVHLHQLGDESAAVRLAAQRWLALHVDPERHWTEVDEVAIQGDPEILRRLAEALAMHDRNLAAAVRAAGSGRPKLVGVGREALAEMLARWSPGLGKRGQRGVDVISEVIGKTGSRDARATLEVEGHGLGELLDRVSRSFAGRPALVLDPGLDEDVRVLVTDRAATTGPLRGTFAELLLGLSELFRVELEGFGFREQGGRQWIRFCKTGDEGEATGAELVTSWCVRIAADEGADGAEDDGATSEACARALAATGWPAGIAWLEQRARPVGHRAPELGGLLLAAGRGGVAPELVRPQAQRLLYALADAALAHGAPDEDVFADRIAHALLAAGPLGPGGEDLTELALEGWSSLGPRERWLRLVVLEGQRAARPAALAVVLTTIEDAAGGEASASLRFQALRTLTAMPVRPAKPPVLGDPEGTWRWVERHATLDELVDLYLSLHCALPESWRGLGTAPLDGTRAGREAVLECVLFGALRSAGLEHRARVVERFAPFVAELDEEQARVTITAWSQRGADVLLAGLFEELRVSGRTALDNAVLERLALATGRVSFERQRELFERALKAPSDDADALLTLGALSGGDHRLEVRRVLLSRLGGGASTEELTAALVFAADAMRAARLEVERRQFEHNLRLRLPTAMRLDEVQDGKMLLREYLRGVSRWGAAEPEGVERRERSLALTGPP